MQYKDENDLQVLKDMIDAELVEPYTVFTFRMFVGPWPQLCHFCYVDGEPVGVVVCKIDRHKSGTLRGYLGMIVVKNEHRKRGIGVLLQICAACCVSAAVNLCQTCHAGAAWRCLLPCARASLCAMCAQPAAPERS